MILKKIRSSLWLIAVVFLTIVFIGFLCLSAFRPKFIHTQCYDINWDITEMTERSLKQLHNATANMPKFHLKISIGLWRMCLEQKFNDEDFKPESYVPGYETKYCEKYRSTPGQFFHKE